MTLSREYIQAAVAQLVVWLLLPALMMGEAGCSYRTLLEVVPPPDSSPINGGQVLLIDVVRVQGDQLIRKIESISSCQWFVDYERAGFDAYTTNWKVTWSGGEAQLYRIKDGMAIPVLPDGRVALESFPLPKPLFGQDHVPQRVFVFANYDLATIAQDVAGRGCGRRLEFDPHETRDIRILIKQLRLERADP